jgi:hypothetical protein
MSQTEFSETQEREAIEGPIGIPPHSLLFLFNVLALHCLPAKSLKYHLALFSICTALRSFARTSVPIRPLVGFGIPTLESGNNAGTLTVLFPYLLYFCVPSRACKSLEFQIKVLCHGRGREFESRRPRRSSRWYGPIKPLPSFLTPFFTTSRHTLLRHPGLRYKSRVIRLLSETQTAMRHTSTTEINLAVFVVSGRPLAAEVYLKS